MVPSQRITCGIEPLNPLAQTWPMAIWNWDPREEEAIQRVVRSTHVTIGKEVEAFESEFAAMVGTRYAVMVNSGSSANLLMAAVLKYREHAPLHAGDEVIVPALAWGTTYFPFAEHGFTLRVVDVDAETFNMMPRMVERAITPKTKAVVAVSALGQPCDLPGLKALCDERGLILLEDECESMGATIGTRSVGSYGLMSSFSFYFSHHMSTGEGGAVVTDDEECYHLLVALREHGWARRWPEENQRFDVPADAWSRRFCFLLPGYNVRPMDIQGAVGRVQLPKLPEAIQKRRRNEQAFRSMLNEFPGLRLQSADVGGTWFGFGMKLEGIWKSRRYALASALLAQGVDSRPVAGGNILQQPVCQFLPIHPDSRAPVCAEIHTEGLMIGNHEGDMLAVLPRIHCAIESVLHDNASGKLVA